MPRAAARSSTTPPSYREAYATLSRIVAELEAGDTDLDRVLPLLDEARAAYEVCQGRIAAVAQAVGQADWLVAEDTEASQSAELDMLDEEE